MKRQFAAFIMGMAMWSVTGKASEIELFRASQAGEKAWVWDTAQAKQTNGKLLVRLHNAAGDSGNAFIADRFPYFPNEKIEVTVTEVPRGNYTLQVLGFRKDHPVATANLIDGSVATGRQQFDLKAAGFGKGVDQVMFKVWVGGAKAAAVLLDDLVLTLPLDGFTAALDESFQDAAAWENESLAVSNSPAGLLFTLKPGTSYGSVRGLKRLAQQPGLTLLWNVARADAGDASLQVVAFDSDGKYLTSLDVVKNAQAGWHAAALDSLSWPAGTTSFEIKIWVGGEPSAVVRFGRLLILRPAP